MDAGGFSRVTLFEIGEAFAEAGCILVCDGKDTDAALGAAWMADEVWAGAAIRIGHSDVDDLDESLRQGADLLER